MKAECFLVRYADDFIMGFHDEQDASRVMSVIAKRFEKYGLGCVHELRLVPKERV